MQQATNDVSQMGTEELVEDDLHVRGFSCTVLYRMYSTALQLVL